MCSISTYFLYLKVSLLNCIFFPETMFQIFETIIEKMLKNYGKIILSNYINFKIISFLCMSNHDTLYLLTMSLLMSSTELPCHNFHAYFNTCVTYSSPLYSSQLPFKVLY